MGGLGDLPYRNIEQEIENIKDLKQKFLSRKTSKNADAINYWVRYMNQAIRERREELRSPSLFFFFF
jgi:hypothetical protein